MRRILLLLAAAAAIGAGASAAALPAMAQNIAADRIGAACAAMGLNPSEAPFAYCERSLAESAPPQPYAMNPPAAMSDAGGYTGPGLTGTGISHNAANACAALGLDPRTARFSYCVSDLNHTLFQEQAISAQ